MVSRTRRAVRLRGCEHADNRAAWTGGSRETTLGEALRDALGYPSALIDTDFFNWTTVPGESNKRVVFDAVRSVAEVYIRNGYNVIVSGLIFTDEDRGGIELLASASRFYGHSFHDFYCDVDLATAVERSNSRDREISAADIEQWWSADKNDVDNVAWPVHRLPTSRPVADLVNDVLRIAGARCNTALRG